MSDTERDDLVRALTEAIKADESVSILSRPSKRFLELAKTGIEVCPSFRAIQKKSVYSADSLIPMHSKYLARIIHYHGQTGEEQADWLLHMMQTLLADGYFIAAIWGIELTETIQLTPNARLVPFSSLPDSYVRRTLTERGSRRGSSLVWLSPNFFQVPTAAYVEEIKEVPYIGGTARPADMISEAFERATAVWPLVEMLGAGQPLVFGSWFEYTDQSLDVSAFENYPSFYHPEVAPRIAQTISIDVPAFRADLAAFQALPRESRNRLIRAAKRYSLGLCRREIVDRTLDLALAFEIMLGGNDGAGGIGWKLAVRCAQVVGGPLPDRLAMRKLVNEFYGYRSRASHGNDPSIPKESVDQATELFKRTFRALVRLGKEPLWPEIEMESPTGA